MKRILLLLAFVCLTLSQTYAQQGRWTAEKANAWYARQPFLFGPNYNPANAINELEMFQAETFDPKTIDKELGWAESMGVNTLRVFLHDLLWQQDPEGFKKRLDQFLTICQKHKIRPMLVLFDSCWDPFPKLGKQRDPQPGIHNSGWLQSPGAAALTDVSQYPRLEAYVKGVIGAFKNDQRILLWDLWNEPDNTNNNSYGDENLKQEPKGKPEIVTRLLPEVFRWARAAGPTQPLTSGVWILWAGHDWGNPAKWSAMEKVQFENSDIITFHNYMELPAFEKSVKDLKKLGRPVICTEFMARGAGSKFQTHMPAAKREKVGMICWGFVAGKTQTNLPWDSWQKPYVNREPAVWHHEILRPDGSPYDPAEVAAIKQAMGK
ncbi:cellulase family glycosylhydrolase [Arsenicibacter rosenii]|uniref:1,4-beta-xylanase n=1 Tax=Arsenicibacter rosenii TaxID=1750698 RepID=A0A1S2VD45_9BACT|nr:cellulase family glycosylhydrolase [Arsenicibacter rosenii]OIN56634.1 1,4-beta-xylanase [Arsenicibacter rosenii]